MKRSFKNVTKVTAAIVGAMLLLNPLTAYANTPPAQPTPVPTPPPTQPDPLPSPDQSERQPFLEFMHPEICWSGLTPEDYDLPGDSWNAYDLAEAAGNPFKLTLFSSVPSDEITITDDEEGLYKAKLVEKQALLGDRLELTDQLNELVLVNADGGHFPHTTYNEHKQFLGTMQPVPYNGVTHVIVIAEQYTVQPGDTLSQIILDCGWMPEGAHLYGPDGYLAKYAEQQKIDLDALLIPGEVVRWRSEEIRILDNLYPDIEIGIIPGSIIGSGEPIPY